MVRFPSSRRGGKNNIDIDPTFGRQVNHLLQPAVTDILPGSDGQNLHIEPETSGRGYQGKIPAEQPRNPAVPIMAVRIGGINTDTEMK